jgi:hypothetical protein
MLRELDLTDNYPVYSNFASHPPLIGGIMSFQAMAWAVGIKLPAQEKITLVMLSNYANEEGRCWPSIDTLCVDTGLSRATVKRALKRLEERKLLIKAKRSKGPLQTSNLYKLEWG